jgi:hypothetical protein
MASVMTATSTAAAESRKENSITPTFRTMPPCQNDVRRVLTMSPSRDWLTKIRLQKQTSVAAALSDFRLWPSFLWLSLQKQPERQQHDRQRLGSA